MNRLALACLALALLVGNAAGQGAATATSTDLCQSDPACRERYERAIRLSEARDYSRALEEFQAAYALRKEPRLLVNIGRCLFRIGRARPALESLQRYQQLQQEQGVQIPAAEQQTLNRFIAEAQAAVEAERPVEASTARLRIQGGPVGVEVLVDGLKVGVVPLSAPITLTPGRHRVELSGSLPQPRWIEVTAGQDVVLDLIALGEQGASRQPRPRWRIAVGAVGLALGLSLSGLGAAAISVAGTCIDRDAMGACQTTADVEGRRSVRIYDSLPAGGAMLGVGLSLSTAGIVLLALPGERRRTTWQADAGGSFSRSAWTMGE